MKSLASVLATVLMLANLSFAQESINLRRTTTVEVVEKTKNAVVYISSTRLMLQRFTPFGADPFWQQFDFGTQVRQVGSLGSGFIVHPDGYIVTNTHVIDRAREITVTLLDGRKYVADLVSADTDADLAILKIKTDTPLPAIPLGDSSDLMIGEPVIAVGNPLGFSHSVSTGIVSAVHRDLKSGDVKIILADVIQTDAAINPGNSGGPLLNAYGQVIGINTAVRGDAQNIGFAIQVNRLRDLIPDLLNPAQVRKMDIPLKLKEQRTISAPANVKTVLQRADDGVAVLKIDGKEPRDIVDAYTILLNQTDARPFDVVLADGKTIKIHPKPVALPTGLVKAKNRIGVTVEQITPLIAERLGLGQMDTGVYVTSVSNDSLGKQIGLQPSDVIIVLGRARIRTLDDFASAVESLPEKGRVPIVIQRGPAVGRGILQL